MNYIESLIKSHQWLRFLLAGSVNTVFSYIIYLVLSNIMGYQLAYLIAFILGVIFSYWLNARMVFNAPLSWRGLFAFPLVYLVQYAVSAASLELFVGYLNLSYVVAPLIVTILMVPVSYVMSKFIINATSAV